MLKKQFILWVYLFYSAWAPVFADTGKPIPNAPTQYVYDEPALLSESARQVLYKTLSDEDRKTGNQVLVAIFKSLDQEDLFDYTNRLYKAWKIGSKDKNNGVLLAIYLSEKKMRFEVGYGLEPYLTDAKSKRILSTILRPAFQQKNYDLGVVSAVEATLSAIHGTESTPSQNQTKGPARNLGGFFVLILGLIFFIRIMASAGNQTISSRNQIRRNGSFWGGDGGGFSGGGYGGGGGFGSGDGGGFSGGGGLSGGGGASGDW